MRQRVVINGGTKMVLIPEITISDWKDWAERHDMNPGVPDEAAFAEALHNVYLREQEIEDQREANREKHAPEKEETPTKGIEASTSMGDNSDNLVITKNS